MVSRKTPTPKVRTCLIDNDYVQSIGDMLQDMNKNHTVNTAIPTAEIEDRMEGRCASISLA